MTVDQGRPVVQRREHREHHAADQHVVQMGDDKVGVVHLPVERQDRDHHARQPTEHEREQEAEHEQRGRGVAQVAAPQGRNPREYLHRRRHGHHQAGRRDQQHLPGA